MRTPSTPDLRLRFPIDQIAGLAAAYAYAEDTEVRTTGPKRATGVGIRVRSS